MLSRFQWIALTLVSLSPLSNCAVQAFTPGGCYFLSDKYCPHILSSCSHQDNMGYNWTLQGRWKIIGKTGHILTSGVCISKSSVCPSLAVKEMCGEVSCPAGQYLCHPRGCLPISSHCNGHCPQLQDGLLCGDSCLTGEEARSKYQCGDSCQVTSLSGSDRLIILSNCQRKSQPCSISSEDICPQHFQLCGSDTCIDR